MELNYYWQEGKNRLIHKTRKFGMEKISLWEEKVFFTSWQFYCFRKVLGHFQYVNLGLSVLLGHVPQRQQDMRSILLGFDFVSHQWPRTSCGFLWCLWLHKSAETDFWLIVVDSESVSLLMCITAHHPPPHTHPVNSVEIHGAAC